jgi:hypothetical protein
MSRTRQKKEYEPPRGVTPPASSFPSLTGERLLPLLAVGSVKFEELCCDILRKEFREAQRWSLKRKRGQAQFGVDVEGFDVDAEPFVVISAKCYAKIQGRDLRPWTKDFTDHLDGHWKGKRVRHFVLAVSHEGNDDEINDVARELTAELGKQGIRFALWNSYKITELLREDPGLVLRYFNRYWAEAVCGDVVVGHPSIENTAPIASDGWAALNFPRMVAAELEAMSGKLGAAWSNSLDVAIADLRQGKSSSIRNWVRDAKADHVLWTNLAPDVRARAVRAAALVALREDDVGGAAGLMDEANTLAPAPDRSLEAVLARAQAGLDAGLACLGEPQTPRERELKAALLIESGDSTAALAVLDPLKGDHLSAEAMRLRAIAQFILGDVAMSLGTAMSAARRGGNTAAPRFTLATIQLAAAMAPGVKVQFGGAPDPIAPSLVRHGSEAVRMLSDAVEGFDRLLVDVEGEFRSEIEVWKLAALLLNPRKQADARRYARMLMSRSPLDPSVIAWCLHCGLPMRRGKVKKAIGDLLRRGGGTPGHVVVLALMSSKFNDPGPGLAVVRRFAPLFPSASEFFAMWRMQLGEHTEPPEQSYSTAIRWAISHKDNAPLLAFLATPEASVENIMSAAEFLAATRSYADVLSLKDRLTDIGTVRSIELVARAANRMKDFSECLRVIDGFKGDALPMRLRYPRLEAHEGLGQHSHVIADLRGMLQDGDDPRVHDRLLHAYMRIGALKELKAETEKALASRILDSRQAIQIAYALKTASPDTARQALERVPEKDYPPELSGILLTLATSLGGLERLRETIFRQMAGGGDGFGNVVKFETVEDILKFIQERADGYRQTFAKWLSGTLPAAVAMRSDEKAYGALFLGSSLTRRNNIGDPFPMLLLGRGASQAPIEVRGTPTLVVDLSGLLLAHRLGLLDDLDKAFQVLVPVALPEALLQLRDQYSKLSPEVAAAAAAIERKSSAVRIAARTPEETIRVEDIRNPADGEEWIVAALLDRAFNSGHITRDEIDRVTTLLDLETNPISGSLPDAGVSLSRNAVAQLAQLDALEPIGRSLPTYLLESEFQQLLDSIEVVREEEKIGDSIERLQEAVARRLSAETWRTLPDTLDERDDERFYSLPAHIRCLMESLPKQGHADRNAFFWIEDRTLSKQRLQNALYLPDILKTLTDKGILSTGRHAAVLRNLWSAGYSFMPVSHLDIAQAVAQAPVAGGELVENAPLVDVRRWFAMQASNLEHIDPAIQLNADGTIIGETRQLFDLVHLLKDLLVVIWKNPDATVEQKVARSAWAWMCLRLEYAPGHIANNSPSGRRRLAGLVATQVISLPLLAKLTSEELSEGDRKSFISWAVGLIDVSAIADPELYEEVLESLAVTAARVLEDPPDVEVGLLSTLRASMRAVVHDFLNLLPQAWYDDIAARHGIGEKLGRQKVMTIELAEDVTVRIADITEAIREADANRGEARLPIHGSKRFCRLESTRSDGGIGAVSLTVGKRSFALHASTVGLVHPDPEVRSRSVEALKQAALPDRSLSAEILGDIAADADVERRVARFDEARGGQFRRELESLQGRVQAGRALPVDAFDLPAPEALLDFLGLPPEYRDGAERLVADATEALSASIGPAAAVERLAALPWDLPRSLLDRFVRQAEPADGPRQWDSPLWAVTRALARRSLATDTVQSFEHVVPLLQASRGIFAGLARYAARKSVIDARWQKLPRDTQVCLIWLFADHVSRALLPAGFKTAEFNRWLGWKAPATFTGFELQRDWPRWARDLTLQLSSARVEAAIVARLLKSGIDVPADLKALVGVDRQGNWLPNPEGGAAAIEGPAELWALADPVPSFIAAGWISAESPFSGRSDTAMVKRILEEAQSDSAFIAPAISLLADIEMIEGEVLAEVRAALERRLAEAPLDRTEPAHHALLEIFARTCAIQAETELFESTLSSVATANARMWPHQRLRPGHQDEGSQALDALLNAAQMFSTTKGGSLADQMRQFTKNVDAIVEAWPTANLAAISCLDVVVRKLGAPTAAEAIWPILMRLRARP